MTHFRFRKQMCRSWDPFIIPLELCYITKRETSKAQLYFVEQFVISKPCSLYFLLICMMNTKPEDWTVFHHDFVLSCLITDRTMETLTTSIPYKEHWQTV